MTLLLELQDCILDVKYQQKKKMFDSDALSRLQIKAQNTIHGAIPTISYNIPIQHIFNMVKDM